MKIAVAACALLMLVAPSFAAADTFQDPSEQVIHLIAIVASLQAQIVALGGKKLACAMTTNTKVVHVDQPFVLAWGSVGAILPGENPDVSTPAPNDYAIVHISKPGKWQYRLTFYAASGQSVFCTTNMLVE